MEYESVFSSWEENEQDSFFLDVALLLCNSLTRQQKTVIQEERFLEKAQQQDEMKMRKWDNTTTAAVGTYPEKKGNKKL